ncbi:MAG: hypothetical protein ACI4TI_01380 [Christensenellales bacterium]
MKYLSLGFIFLIIGSVVGAGFASGKEIVVFFSGAGKLSYVIILLVAIFLYFVIKNLIILGKDVQSKNIKDVNKILFKKSHAFFDAFIIIGLFVFITAMIAGINSIGEIIFSNIHFPVITIISVFFCFFIVLLGVDAIKKVNLVLMPIVLILIVVVCFASQNFCAENLQVSNSLCLFFKYLCLGICYISYNFVFSSSLIFEKSKDLSPQKIKANSFVITIILTSLIFVVNFSMLKFNSSSDLPMLSLAFLGGNVLGYLFAFSLWFSILTSMISSLYMLVNTFKTNKFFSASLILTLSFIFSFFGFSSIVNFVYPLQGFVGLAFIFKVFVHNKKFACQTKNSSKFLSNKSGF